VFIGFAAYMNLHSVWWQIVSFSGFWWTAQMFVCP